MKRPGSRSREGGSITVLAAIMLVVLFSMAALAVDTGFLYTRSRMIYAVADSAVTAGMGDLVAGSTANAQQDVDDIMGKYGATYSYSRVATSGQLSVTVSATYPLFFGAMLGYGSKTVSVTSIGTITNPAPALLSLGACGGFGIQVNGGGNLNIHGNVESDGNLTFSATSSTVVNGFAESPCAGSPSLGGSPPTITGGSGSGGPWTDPFLGAAAAFPACYPGTSLLFPSAVPAGAWSAGGVLAPGVYCSGGPLNVASPDPCNCMVAAGVSFVALGDITLGNNGTSSLSPAAGMPDNIVAYTASATDCGGGGEAINIGFNTFNIQGSIYAPNGCVNMGDNGGLTVNGSVIAKSIQIGANGTWDIGPNGGGGGGNAWQMSQ